MESEPDMNDAGSRGDPASSEDSAPEGSRLRRVASWTGAILGVLVILGWIAATTGFGMGTAIPYALQRFAPEGWSVQVRGVDGSWLGRIELSDLAIEGPSVDFEAQALLLRYRLRPLLDKRVAIEELVLEEPSVRLALPDTTLEEKPDSTPSILPSLLSGRPAGAWSASVASAEIHQGRAEVWSNGRERYTLSGLEAAGSGSLDGDGLAFEVDTLGGAFISVLETPADSVFRSEGRLAFAGALSRGTLQLDTLAIVSDYSEVAGGGRLTFVEHPDLWGEVDLEVEARPLDLRDLPVQLPEPFLAQPDVFLLVRAEGSPDSLVLEMEGEMLGGETTVDVEAVVRRAEATGGDHPEVEGSLSVTGVDLSPWSPAPFDGRGALAANFALTALQPEGAYSASGSFRHDPRSIDPSRLVTRPFAARFEVTGALPGDSVGGAPLRADADVEIEMERPSSRVGTISAVAEGTSATWEVDLELGSGSLDGTGTVAWGTEMAATLEGLRFSDVDLTAVDTLYPATQLTGQIQGRVHGTTLEDLQGNVDLVLGPSRFAESTVDSVVVSSGIQGLTFDGTLFALSDDLGDVRSRYVVELVDSVVHFDSSELSYIRPDSSGAGSPLGAFHGQVSGSWTLSETRAATLRATVDSARWDDASVGEGRVDARITGERIEGEAELTATGLLPSPIRLRGRADVTGTTMTTATGAVALVAAQAHSESTGRVDTVRVEVTAAEAGRFVLDGMVQPAEGGSIAIEGTAEAAGDSLAFDLTAAGRLGESTALLGGAQLDSLHLTASGRRVGDVWDSARGQVAITDARWNRLRAERIVASIRYDSTGVSVDTLDVRSNVLSALGQGRIPAGGSGGSIDITAEIMDLDPLREIAGLDVLVAGDGTIQASLAGSLDSLDWQADLDLEALVVNQLRMTGVRFGGEGVVAAPYDFLFGLSSSDMQLTFDRILLPRAEVRRVSIGASGGADSLRVEAEAIVDDTRRATMLVHVDPRPEGRTARIEDLQFQIDEDRWRLANQAVLRYGSGVTVEPILLRAGEQEIRLEGGVSEAGDLDLNARMDSTDVGTVADLVGFPRLRGWLSGRLRVQGTTDSPEAWLDVAGALHRQGRRPGPVEVRVRANGRRVRGDIELLDANQGLLRLTGGALMPGVRRGSEGGGEPSLAAMRSSPLDEKVFGLVSDSMDVTLEAGAFDLRWTEAFFAADVLGSIAGRLDGSIRLEGSSSDPELSGAIRMREGAAYPTALGVRWDGIRMTLRGQGTTLVVDSARISGSSGVATASGTIEATGTMPLDLTVGLDGFHAIRTDAYRAVASGSLGVGGAVMAPVIDGDLRLESLDVFLDERVTSSGLEPVEFTDEDLRMLRERFGIVPDANEARRPLAERITADLNVELGRDSWLRKRTSPEMAVPFSGTMQVELRPGQPPMLQGSVDVIAGRGFVEQFGRRFDLADGTVTFNGSPAETRVDLEATYTIPSRDNPDDAEVTIILEVTGTQEDLSLTLSSEPPMENADIVSYIATGRPAAGSLSFEGGAAGGGLVAAGADFALSQFTSLIEGAAAGSVGLDVVEIRREGLRQATLVAGKYVTPRLYVGFAQPISLQEGNGLSFGSEGRSELEIEYEAWRWLLLNVEGSGSSVRFFLRGRHAY